jgi:hypothetical protein
MFPRRRLNDRQMADSRDTADSRDMSPAAGRDLTQLERENAGVLRHFAAQ